MTEQEKEQLNIMEHGQDIEKCEWLEQLAESGDIALIVPLASFMEREKSRAVKDRIMLTLERLLPLSGYRDAEVEQMMRSPDPQTRNGVVEIIKRSEIPIIRFLEKLSEDEDKDVRKFVIDALSREDSPQARIIIRRRLHDADINIRYTAVEYLGNFKDEDSAEEIETLLLESSHMMLTCSALEALARIRCSPRSEEIKKRFMNLENDPMINFPLLKYLGSFGGPEALAYIEELIVRYPLIFGKEIIDATGAITRNIGITRISPQLQAGIESLIETTANPVDKYAAVKLLAAVGRHETGSQLLLARRMLESEDEMIQLSAVELLAEIGEKEDIARLEQLADATGSDELLETIGDAAMKIRERLGDGQNNG